MAAPNPATVMACATLSFAELVDYVNLFRLRDDCLAHCLAKYPDASYQFTKWQLWTLDATFTARLSEADLADLCYHKLQNVRLTIHDTFIGTHESRKLLRAGVRKLALVDCQVDDFEALVLISDLTLVGTQMPAFDEFMACLSVRGPTNRLVVSRCGLSASQLAKLVDSGKCAMITDDEGNLL